MVNHVPMRNTLENFIRENAQLIDSVFTKKQQKTGLRSKLSSVFYKFTLIKGGWETVTCVSGSSSCINNTFYT